MPRLSAASNSARLSSGSGSSSHRNEPAGGTAHLSPLRKRALYRADHLVNVLGEGPPDPAEMAVIAAARQEIGERSLRQGRTGQRRGKLVFQHALHMAPGRDPADPVTRRNGLRERAARDGAVRWVERA